MSQKMLYRYLDTNGDGTGDKDAIGNFLFAPIDYYIKPGPTEVYAIERVIIFIKDNGRMNTGGYGAGGLLENGITCQIQNDTEVLVDMTDGIPVRANGDWSRLCYDLQNHEWGTGHNVVVARWTLAKTGISGQLDGRQDRNQKLVFRVNDDLRGLVEHTFQVQGRVLT